MDEVETEVKTINAVTMGKGFLTKLSNIALLRG